MSMLGVSRIRLSRFRKLKMRSAISKPNACAQGAQWCTTWYLHSALVKTELGRHGSGLVPLIR